MSERASTSTAKTVAERIAAILELFTYSFYNEYYHFANLRPAPQEGLGVDSGRNGGANQRKRKANKHRDIKRAKAMFENGGANTGIAANAVRLLFGNENRG